MDIRIRQGGPDDILQVMEVVGRSLLSSYGRFMPWEYLEEWFSEHRHIHTWTGYLAPDSRYRVFLAVERTEDARENVLGVLMVDGDLIHELWVYPGCQGRGIGSLLMDHAEALIGSRGHELARLYVYSPNSQAQAFYEHRGYRVLEEHVSEQPATKGLAYRIMGRETG